MTTHDDALFVAAVNRGRELLPQVDPEELTSDEAKRILLDSAVLCLHAELGVSSYEDGVEMLSKAGRGALEFYMPEFCSYMRRTA